MTNKTKEKKMFTINKITSNHVVDFAAEELKINVISTNATDSADDVYQQ